MKMLQFKIHKCSWFCFIDDENEAEFVFNPEKSRCGVKGRRHLCSCFRVSEFFLLSPVFVCSPRSRAAPPLHSAAPLNEFACF